MATTDPWPVAPDELVESAWGNAVVGTLGPVSTLWTQPPGWVGNVAERLLELHDSAGSDAGRLATLEATVAGLVHQNGLVAVVGIYVVGTTDASGYLTVTHPTFTAYPTVVVTGAESNHYTYSVRRDWQSNSAFVVQAINPISDTIVANAAVAFNYLASGTLA